MTWDGKERRQDLQEANERMLVIELQAKHTEELLKQYIADTKAYRENNSKLLENLQAEITRYKGFIGGVLFIFSAIWAIVALFKQWIKIGT